MNDIEFLATVPMLSSLSSAELERMGALWVTSHRNEGQVIFSKGDLGNSLYLIKEGMVTISLTGMGGEEIILSELHRGDIFGELTLFDNVPRTATAVAFEDTTLLEMRRDVFINFLKNHPDIAISLLSILGQRLRNTNDLMQEQTTRNLNEEIENELSFSERLADKVALFVGSWKFIIAFLIVMFGWIMVNFFALIIKPVDPYPFILLNLLLSCIAAIQAPVIMMSQGRQAKKDRLAADLDYKINLKSELQIQQILVKLDKINAQQQRTFQEQRRGQKESVRRQPGNDSIQP